MTGWEPAATDPRPPAHWKFVADAGEGPIKSPNPSDGVSMTSPDSKPTSFRAPADGRLSDPLFRPVSIAWLVYLRIVFAAGLAAFVFFAYQKGWNYLTKAEDLIYFPHAGFEWLRPLPPAWMHLPYIVLVIAAAGIGLGLLYRLCIAVATLSFAYLLFLDQTIYQNHLYLTFLLGLLLSFMPAHRAFSLDALLRPGLRSPEVPVWTLFIIRFQLGVVYFYGGLAKLNVEWLSLRSVAAQLDDLRETMHPALAPLADSTPFIALLTYGGLAFDLLIVPMLLWRRTRLLAFLMVTFFHVTNAFIFPIDFFPSFMLAATAVFFPPDFPERLLRRMLPKAAEDSLPASEANFTANPSSAVKRKIVTGLLAVFVLFQLLYPLRHYLYPGDVYWTSLGDNFSWQMRTMNKSMTAFFLVTDSASGRTRMVDPEEIMVKGQLGKFRAPEMFVRLAREIADTVAEEPDVVGPLQVRAVVLMSLNGGDQFFVFNPNDDLTRGGLHEAARRAVVPLETSWRFESVKPAFAAELFDTLENSRTWSGKDGPFSFPGRSGNTPDSAAERP